MRPIAHLSQRENNNLCVCALDHIPMLKFAIEGLNIILLLFFNNPKKSCEP